jgi:hypothetical protein
MICFAYTCAAFDDSIKYNQGVTNIQNVLVMQHNFKFVQRPFV